MNFELVFEDWEGRSSEHAPFIAWAIPQYVGGEGD